MIKKLACLTILASVLILTSCKEKSKDSNAKDSTSTETSVTPTSEPSVRPTNEPKTYKVSFSPDSAYLGKQKEAFMKITKAEAVDLQDPEGKSQGIELTVNISLTNKNAIGGDRIGISPADFRLSLENGTNITPSSSNYWAAEPESTKESDPLVFTIPAGTKPTALNLFYNNTRVSIDVSLN